MKFHPILLLLSLVSCAELPFTLEPVVRSDDKAPLALIVGIDEYEDPGIDDLRGAVADARNMHALLTDPDGYAFPPGNVMLLTDEAATRKNVLAAFKQGLIARARSGDPVVFFFSGHGAQGPDYNGDEKQEDGRDEILILHDTDSLALGLWDDGFNRLVQRLYQKTTNITVIMDACHTESATRTTGGLIRAVAERSFSRRSSRSEQGARETADGGEGMITIDPGYKPAAMPEMVVISAARDGKPAFDGPRGGLFSRHLIPALGRITHHSLTYRDVEQEVRLALGHARVQLPRFQGNLDRPVFNMTHVRRPVTWRVLETRTVAGERRVDLIGTVMPGIGTGAELRLYRPDTVGRHWLDPELAHATLEAMDVDGFRVVARVLAADAETGIKPDDRAVLVLPGHDAVLFTFRIRPAGHPQGEGVPKAPREALKKALAEDPEAELYLITIPPDHGEAPDLEVVYRDGALVLLDRAGRSRGAFPVDKGFAHWRLLQAALRHARIQAILAMRSDDPEMSDHQRLKIEIIPAGGKEAYGEIFGEKRTGSILLLPPNKYWQVRVTLSPESKESMYVAGFALSGDGTLFPLPTRSTAVLLKPGQAHSFADRGERLRFKPGSGIEDRLVFFAGAQRMDWKKLGEDAAGRARARGSGVENALFRRLNRFMTPGRRNINGNKPTQGNTRFSRTVVTLKAQ